MKNSKITARISLLFALLFLLSFTAVQAQEGMDIKNIHKQTLGVYGYPLGVSELEHTDSLTTSQRNTVEDIKGKLDALAPGLETFCRLGREIKAEAFSDYHPFKNVSKQESDLLNDKLAWDRLRKALRYLIDQKGVPEKCFVNRDPVYADSKVRGVQFKVSEHRKLQMDNQAIAEITQKLASLEADLHQLKKKVEQQGDQIAKNSQENDLQDSVLVDHGYWLDNHESRLTELEDKSSVFSTYLGFGFGAGAGEGALLGTVGLQVNQIDLSVWYGYNKDIGYAFYQGNFFDQRREYYGAGLTWYPDAGNGLAFDGSKLGIRAEFNHHENIIRDHEVYTRGHEVIAVGPVLDIQVHGSLYVRAGISWAIMMNTFTVDDREYRHNTPRLGASFTLGIKL